MKPFISHRGKVAVLDWTDVNTDLIIPARYLKRIERTGYGPLLFADKRYAPGGAPSIDHPESHGALNAEFPLNRPETQGATILAVGKNFGCGSSREHAPWALNDYGFDAIIAPSFADIFYNNCSKNGMVLVTLPEEQVHEIGSAGSAMIDLEGKVVVAGGKEYAFEIDEGIRHNLINGLDDISITLQEEAAIDQYETSRERKGPVTTALA